MQLLPTAQQLQLLVALRNVYSTPWGITSSHPFAKQLTVWQQGTNWPWGDTGENGGWNATARSEDRPDVLSLLVIDTV